MTSWSDKTWPGTNDAARLDAQDLKISALELKVEIIAAQVDKLTASPQPDDDPTIRLGSYTGPLSEVEPLTHGDET